VGGVFLSWAIVATSVLILTVESYEAHLAIIMALIVFGPFVLLFPFYFVSFIILLITSGMRLIKREGKKLRNFLSIVLGVFFVVCVIVFLFLFRFFYYFINNIRDAINKKGRKKAT